MLLTCTRFVVIFFFFSSRRRHTRCALVTGVQTCALPILGAAKAREWIDRDGVTALADLTNSAVALAVQEIAKKKNTIAMFSGPASTALTNDHCSPTGFHWMLDTYSQSVGGVRSEEHTSELQSLMRISYAVFCLKTKNK